MVLPVYLHEYESTNLMTNANERQVYIFIKLDFHSRFTIGPSSSLINFTTLIIIFEVTFSRQWKYLVFYTPQKLTGIGL